MFGSHISRIYTRDGIALSILLPDLNSDLELKDWIDFVNHKKIENVYINNSIGYDAEDLSFLNELENIKARIQVISA